jgi:outer membrane protein TolC
LAYKNNPLLLSARAQTRSADYGVPVARSAYGPSLTVTMADTFTRTKEELLAGLWVGTRLGLYGLRRFEPAAPDIWSQCRQ